MLDTLSFGTRRGPALFQWHNPSTSSVEVIIFGLRLFSFLFALLSFLYRTIFQYDVLESLAVLPLPRGVHWLKQDHEPPWLSSGGVLMIASYWLPSSPSASTRRKPVGEGWLISSIYQIQPGKTPVRGLRSPALASGTII